ncbi:hypothetical protein [Pseudomonas sp. GD03944]|uniref:DUF6966 domain-containing protein n=1 Tax=Pseudomonas sp. GD03944 TaxID=2975409 RepID=UPI00244C8ACF|nr:hypothetical protein [Pseudomonas sp. GD03944]MDH1264631.1 hypothetical protein [Pseudomonas sp. GD03944]
MATNLRPQQLESLQAALASLCELLRLDKPTHWRDHFERCLHTTDHLLTNGFDQSTLNSLSCSVRQVFGGMGSFNDYVPVTNTRDSSDWYRKHGNPEEIVGLVYDSALCLMVVEQDQR